MCLVRGDIVVEEILDFAESWSVSVSGSLMGFTYQAMSWSRVLSIVEIDGRGGRSEKSVGWRWSTWYALRLKI